MTGQRKVKVLIVDDSAVVRQTLEQLLASDPDIEVIAARRIRISLLNG